MKFNVNFNLLLSKYVVHLLVKIKKTSMTSRFTVQSQRERERGEREGGREREREAVSFATNMPPILTNLLSPS